MTDLKVGDACRIETIEELLAHAIMLEEEAVARYDEFADSMEVHNNPEAAQLLRQLAGYGRKHAAEVARLVGDRQLPRISPWEFKWHCRESPEMAALGDAHYLMTPYHALKLAHGAEMSACSFYTAIAKASTDAEVRTMAQRFADEEAEHVALLEEWMKRFPKPEKDWDYDPDPPMMPE